MLRVRFPALRQAERSRTLVSLRLNSAVHSLRWKSTDHDGGRPTTETRPGQPGQPPFHNQSAPVMGKTGKIRDSIDTNQNHVSPSSEGDPFDILSQTAEGTERPSRKAPVASLSGVSEELRAGQRVDMFKIRPLAPNHGHEMAATQMAGDRRSEPNPPEFLHRPTDPAKLKALPTGFDDMTEREQQEELWVVQAEERLGREWELEDPGKHSPYTHDYPPYSPSKVIGMLHRWRNWAWTSQQWRLARAIAANRSLRFPVLTAQAFLRRHVLLARQRGVELKIERYLGSTEEWKARLADLENQTGISEADIKQWLWILSPSSGDVQIQRFLKSRCRKPIFLLQLLLARDRKIQEPATFLGLLKYLRENYVLADRPQDELDHPTYKGQGRAVTWWHYIVFLYRLVWHCREGWPAAMPLLARLTADYIGTMRLDSKARAMTGYQARSLVLNKALQYFSWAARVRPIDHMEHNWAAQRHLLRLAATTEPPLVMDQNGYRAVRTVLIGLNKTKGEAKNADRTARTWPPYRRTLDGIDERRNPEDDLSRSAKAGLLVRAAGYSDDVVDRALSALGGSTFGEAPTIQTRSIPPPFFSGRLASQNIYSEWAAQLRATRNPREAWIVFEHPPEPGIRPTAQIYGEMFERLYARPATGSSAVRPGDVKEVFPVDNGSLSEFEIARLTPPSPEELYGHMLQQDKLQPTGFCLAVLIRNSSSIKTALRYLEDSPYKPYIDMLRAPTSQASTESTQALAKLPHIILNAWITMLCRIHTRERAAAGSTSADGHSHRSLETSRAESIPEAIAVASMYQARNAKAAQRDRLPWHTIMQALAGRKVLYSQMGAEFNALETLETFLKVYERTTAAKGIDPVAFEALCLVIRKTLRLTTFEKAEGGSMVPRPYMSGAAAIQTLLFRAHRRAVDAFAALTSPLPAERGDDDDGGGSEKAAVDAEGDAEEVEEADDDGVTPGMLRYNVVGRPLHRYMAALACCGDDAEMVRVMDWLLDGWDRGYIREEAKTLHNLDYHYTMRTIAYFAEMGKELVEPAEMDRLRGRLENMRWDKGCTWFWPQEGWQEEAQVQALPELETDLVSANTSSSAFTSDDGFLSDTPVEFDIHQSKSIQVELPSSTLVHPKSRHQGYIPRFPQTKERDAVSALLEAAGAQGQEEFVEFELDDFSFYVNSAVYPFEMRPLQHLSTRMGHDRFYFDGVLSIGGCRHYVEKVEVSELPIGNYGTAHTTTQGQIWVRSGLNSRREVYYRLGKPAAEYARFHIPFLWVVDLAKHVVDFSAAMISQGRQVRIRSFETHFIQWVHKTHGRSAEIDLWRRRHPSDDYRTSATANIDFIWKELNVIDRVKVGDTISTPRDEVTTGTKWRNMASKGAAENDRWFGLVQRVHTGGDGSRSFDVTWFYRPVETPCCMMQYPWPDELFLSDHCTCEEGHQSRVKDHEILGVHEIDWFGSPDESKGEFFVRQTYIIESRRWVTLKDTHMACLHGREKPRFKPGDTVLAALSKSQTYAEPYEVVKVFRQGDNMFVRLRRLLRRGQVDSKAGAAPNELVYTDQLVVTKPERVIGKCTVRFFRPEESIPTPYDRKGTGNLFYITHRFETADDGKDRCIPLGEFPTSLRQGFDPAQQAFRKLRGMDLFCGSGNFGRGLEDGGAVEMKWANDIWDRAIHTYMANSPDSNSAKPFLGSVDDLLQLALEGKYTDNVPRPGDVDFISAGSPCPGFSLLTQDKTTLAQIKNQSLVASFASLVDFYRPKYGILENVPTIVQARHNRSEDVLSQLFCAIVGMGYQAQLILGDAWSHGAPQCRQRVFLYFAAPGLRLPDAPLLSHSHYPGVKPRNLGEMCNEEPFVSRSFQPAAFKFTSAAEATADLPLIGDGKPEPATAFPDHRVCGSMTTKLRYQIAAIPIRPYGMSFSTAWYGRTAGNTRNGGRHGGVGDGVVMTPAERERFPAAGVRVSPISNGWRRLRPHDVLQTVTTRCQPTDARAATCLHWADPRPLTVLEIRRAQGFPDHEVLLGTMADQWKLVGNSVARQMALALGLRLREAWVGGMGEVGSAGGREGRSGSESASVSVGVSVAGSVAGFSSSASEEGSRGVGRNGRRPRHRHSTPREIVDLTAAVKEEHAAGRGQTTGTHRHNTTFHDAIDLTTASRSASSTPSGTGRAVRSAPASAMAELGKAGGMRKRLLSLALGLDPEIRPRKVIRLESGASTPIPQPEPESDLGSGLALENDIDESWMHTSEVGPVAPPDPATEEEEAVEPVRTGPTIVRLLTPEEGSESDELDWDRELN
ncbi:uncharacterized protein B0H64DRAFT_368033 [Chaetomium fimeti]|uniref:DNA (cytosine-5-)-methyltransferase n=1 Tax=Chaetomium fimeti TaxID=1854472 RepID=A0AAE0LMA4_9PEZI|nr:hypothetical protein B0H64DRAFT_368033 [Chaetomium fimeti]